MLHLVNKQILNRQQNKWPIPLLPSVLFALALVNLTGCLSKGTGVLSLKADATVPGPACVTGKELPGYVCTVATQQDYSDYGNKNPIDGPVDSTLWNRPTGIVYDRAGYLYVADTDSGQLRKIDTADGGRTYALYTYIGQYTGVIGGYVNGASKNAKFYQPTALAVDSSARLYIADSKNHVIRLLDSNNTVTTLAGADAKNGNSGGFADAPVFLRDARFDNPQGIAVDKQGNVFVADTDNNCIRKITVVDGANAKGSVTTIAGSQVAGYLDDAADGTQAQFTKPIGIAVDSAGNVFVADTGNRAIRKLSPIAGGKYAVSTISKNDLVGANQAAPLGIALDRAGNIYAVDKANHAVHQWKRQPDGSYAFSTIAGGKAAGNVDGDGTLAQFRSPRGITIDGRSNLYISDTENNQIRKLVPPFLTINN